MHTRLSIIDLSEDGAQPMPNEDGTVWVAFNGEIYNHARLRRQLTARGHIFRGRSDTEVLVHLYEEQGPDFVKTLRGMFAISIYDTRRQTLLLARDRFGIKPLFYAETAGRIAFASELTALRSVPGIDQRVDRQAIHDFAALFYIPAPETFFVGIRMLRPGETLTATLRQSKVQSQKQFYHEWCIEPDHSMRLEAAADRAGELISRGVSRQLESDVPLGSLLSGGIDSSLVSTAAQQGCENSIRTFNVRFSEEEYDETWAALAVAQHCGSDHQTLTMQDNVGTWEHVTELLLHAGQPFADTSLFAASAVSRLVRRYVQVALSGDGGDEAFGGYNLFWQVARIARLRRFPTMAWQVAALFASPMARLGLVRNSLPQRILDLSDMDDVGIVQSLFCWIRADEHQRLCHDSDVLPVRRLFESRWTVRLPQNASHVERISALVTEVNTRMALPDDFLFKVDVASMKEGLEVRVPMLDEDLFQFGLTLPHRLKVGAGTTKRVLRKVARRQLPAAVANKPKRGFGIPMDRWVNKEFKIRLRDSLLGRSSQLSEFFRPEAYRKVVEAFCDGRPCWGVSREGLYQRAMMLLSVQLFLEGNQQESSRKRG